MNTELCFAAIAFWAAQLCRTARAYCQSKGGAAPELLLFDAVIIGCLYFGLVWLKAGLS